jgi:hypothetical protein
MTRHTAQPGGDVAQAIAQLVRNSRETLTQPLYDSTTLANGVVGTVNFFQDITGKNTFQTSMLANAILPFPRQFLVQAISVNPEPATTVADMQAILGGSALQFFIGDKEYLTCPAFFAPGGTGVSGFADTTAAVTIQQANNGWEHPNARLALKAPGQLLQSQENFKATLQIPTALVLAATRRVFVFLWGLQLRAVQ